jgi:ABC-type dipeptide/oligopeptide/nickel transport system permease subunit
MNFWSGPWPWIIVGLIFLLVVLRAYAIGRRLRKKNKGRS